MRRSGRLLMISFALLAIFSCAKKESRDTTPIKFEQFDLWMARYNPAAEKLADGLYMEWIEESGSGKTISNDSWMKLNYTGRTMGRGDIYVTRDPGVARQLRYFKSTTHYSPDYLPFFPVELEPEDYIRAYNVMRGQIEALRRMEEGDSVRIFSLSEYGYPAAPGMTDGFFNTGVSVDQSTDIIMDLRLAEIVPDPVAKEKEELRQYVVDVLGMDPDNYVVEGLYVKKTLENPLGNDVDPSRQVLVTYTGKLPDGYVFDTRVEETALENGIYSPGNSYTPLAFIPNEEKNLQEGFMRGVLSLKYGEKAIVVFSSDLGYGERGAIPKIPPFSPLIFEIEVQPGNI